MRSKRNISCNIYMHVYESIYNRCIKDIPGGRFPLLWDAELETYVTVCLSSNFNTVLLLLLLSNSYWNFSLDPEENLLRIGNLKMLLFIMLYHHSTNRGV